MDIVLRPAFSLFRTAMMVVALAFAGASGTAAAASPEQFIDNLARQAIAVTSQNLPQPQKIEQFRTLLNQNFNVQGIGQFVLGRYWRAATDAERAEYLRLFEDYIVHSYAKRFDAYQGEQLKVSGSRQDPASGSVMVGSVLQAPGGGEPVRIDWQVQPAGSSYQVVDVVVEGVSMGVTQRSEFASVIRRGGGKVETIIAALKKILSHI
ncbi:MAG: ABC transporter substrate-binding protein [Rhodospirillales bacterium]